MNVVCCSRDWRILRVNILKFQADDANGMSPSDEFDVEAYSGGNQILAEHVIKVTEHKTYDIIASTRLQARSACNSKLRRSFERAGALW